jgi:release factor glutamine methyltransferase
VRRTLRAAFEESAAAIDRIDAQVLLAHLLGVDRAWLAANPMHVLSESQNARLDTLVARRVLGHPVAYLVEKREFWSREFLVGPEVLIPRPETETLVEAALERVPPRGAILDLGTGSGAIAITLACERPAAAVAATDASEAAIAMARRNALRLGAARVEFACGAWFEPVAGRRFDAIVANPPYVAAADPHLGEGDLRFEPRGALTDESADGLASIRAIVAGASAHLNCGGWLLLEHGYDQAGACRDLLGRAGFASLVSIPDLAGIPRVAGGRAAG